MGVYQQETSAGCKLGGVIVGMNLSLIANFRLSVT